MNNFLDIFALPRNFLSIFWPKFFMKNYVKFFTKNYGFRQNYPIFLEILAKTVNGK